MGINLTKKVIEQIVPTGTKQDFFDNSLLGFTLRVGASGSKVFYYVYRAGKGRGSVKKWLRLGSFPTMTVDQARRLAKEKAASVTLGADPAQEVKQSKLAPLMKDALETFYAEAIEAKRKRNTAAMYRVLIDKYLGPTLGKMRVEDVEFRHLAKLHHNMKDMPYQANRALAAARYFFSWAAKIGYIDQDKKNPAIGIDKYRELARKEFMGADELAIIGDTLTRMEATWNERLVGKSTRTGDLRDVITPPMAAAIRLLMLTGARRGEILALEWERIDLEKGIARLPDSKTGFRVLQLTAPALAVLESLPKIDKWVFPSYSASGHMVNLKTAWCNVLKQAGLTGWRIHDLRHAFASMMVNSGASLPIVGKILGHANPSTTQRYAHLEANPARQAAEEAAAKIAEAMQRKPHQAAVIEFKRK